MLQTWADQPWWQNFRMSKATFLEICAELALELQWWTTYIRAPLNVEKRVAFAIWKLAIPDCYWLASNQLGVGRSTIGAVVMEVCPAIKKVLSPWLIGHGNAQDIIDGFARLGFLNCNGAIDVTHMPILCSPHQA